MPIRSKATLKLTAGEEIPVLVHVGQKSSHRGFFMGENDVLKELVTENDLNGSEMRLLTLMMTLMNWENVVEYSQRELAEMLKTNPVVINRAIATLKTVDAIRDARKIGKTIFYRVSPYLANKVRSKSLKDLVDAWESAA